VKKGTPSQEEYKTIFSSLKINKMAFYRQSDATALFSAVRYTLYSLLSVAFTLTFYSLSIPESQFSQT
jgi:hypothetical protein